MKGPSWELMQEMTPKPWPKWIKLVFGICALAGAVLILWLLR